MMTLTQTSTISGEKHTMELPISEEDFAIAFNLWKNEGECIQDAFPSLSSAQREFIMSGITEEEWEKLC